MTALDALWHLLNAVAAPIGVALLSTLLFKLVWWRHTARQGVGALAWWAVAGAVPAHLGAWAYFGTEGTMIGYAAVVMTTAVVLWFRAFIWASRAR